MQNARKFIKIVKNYERISILGNKIIKHKDLVKHAKPGKLHEEIIKQEARFQEFSYMIEKANFDWEHHSYHYFRNKNIIK